MPEETELEKVQREKAYYMRQCDKYVDHVADLEELLQEWRDFAKDLSEDFNLQDLHKRTAQLLGEE